MELLLKQDLETFSDSDIQFLSRFHKLSVGNRNDLLWLLAIANVKSAKTAHFPSEIDDLLM